jgi:prepilin-type N-terminal cleavage/methylation domain-containing protein
MNKKKNVMLNLFQHLYRWSLPYPLSAQIPKRVRDDRVGFTLAEVLITLGIIGVVAALTIPALVAGYQEKALRTQFQKAFSVVQQLYQKTVFDVGGSTGCAYRADGSGCAEFREALEENLKIVKKCYGKAFADGCIPEYKGIEKVTVENTSNLSAQEQQDAVNYTLYHCGNFSTNAIKNSSYAYVLADGVIILDYLDWPYYFAIDVNGMKGPNRWGYDLFAFAFYNDKEKYFLNAEDSCMPVESGGKSSVKMLNEIYGISD